MTRTIRWTTVLEYEATVSADEEYDENTLAELEHHADLISCQRTIH